MGYLLGFDGGATGTIGVLADLEGNILATASGAASNHLTMARDKVRQVFGDLIGELLRQTGKRLEDCQLATFGLAAIAGESDAAIYRKLILDTKLGGDILIDSDVVIAWAAATAGKPGLAVIAGTGSSCFGVNEKGERFRALGWDYLLADQGSGYWIGLQGLQVAVKAYDGRLENTMLLDAMTRHYQLNAPADILTRAYDDDFGKDKIASFAREVSRCATEGDAAAQQILQSAAHELGDAIIAVARRLNMLDKTFPVGLIGGVFRSRDLILEPIRQRVATITSGAQIDLAPYPAVVGALILGQVYLYGAVSSDFLGHLETSMAQFQQLRWK